MKKIKLAWIATHPIQYQAPLFRAISKVNEIDLEVIYFSNFSVANYRDSEFGTSISWGSDILDGYKFKFLNTFGPKIQQIKTFSPFILGLRKNLFSGKYDAVMVQGWNHYGMLIAAWVCKYYGVKVFIRCEATDHITSSKGLKKWIREKILSYYFSLVDVFFAIGRRNKEFYLSRGVDPGRIFLMPYSVDNNFFEDKLTPFEECKIHNLLSLQNNIPIILFSGKLIPRKRPDLLLRAYELLGEDKPYLIFVGDGVMRSEMEARVIKNRLDRVYFVGFQSQSKIANFYAAADIFVLPSDEETWGLVINEAMVCCCAIIASDRVGSAIDLIRNNVNGVIFESGNVLALKYALNQCLFDKKYEEMGVASKKIIDNSGIAQNVEVLKDVLNTFDEAAYE